MSASSLKTLFTTLQASALLTGVTLSFGQELIAGLDRVPPLVDIVPIGGPWEETGYAQGVDNDVSAIWMTHEQVDLYCYAYSNAGGATAIDHADAARNLSNLALQALQQQASSGLRFWPVRGEWVMASNEFSQFGRAYKLSINLDISMTDITPVYAPTPITATITPSI